MNGQLLSDTAKDKQEVDDVIQQIKDDDLIEIYAVGKTKSGIFTFYRSGRIHGLGAASSILQAEFSNVWNDHE